MESHHRTHPPQPAGPEPAELRSDRPSSRAEIDLIRRQLRAAPSEAIDEATREAMIAAALDDRVDCGAGSSEAREPRRG